MVVFCIVSVNLQAQQRDVSEAVMTVCGVSDPENVDPLLVEHFCDLIRHPVRINSASRSQLEASGLFTPYQMASLSDYLARHGSICSASELAAVDGFGNCAADMLSPFISFEFCAGISNNRKDFVEAEMSLRGGYKSRTDRDERKSMYGLKSRLSLTDKIILSLSTSELYDLTGIWPTLCSGNVTWNHRLGKVVVGDFNARFGQGLCVWNTATFSSLTAPSDFMKRPTGISPSYSFTGSSAMTGIASDFMAGRWKFSAMVSAPGIKNVGSGNKNLVLRPVVNVSRLGRLGHVSLTHTMSFADFMSLSYRIPVMMTSVDASACVRGINMFAESVYDWVIRRISVLGGCEFGAGKSARAAIQARYLPVSNEHAVAFASEISLNKHRVAFSTEGKYHPQSKSKEGGDSFQVKGQADWIWMPLSCIEVKMRISERFRTWGLAWITKCRVDVRYLDELWKASLRIDAVRGADFSCSGYAEAGYTGKMLTVYGRFGLFLVDKWDDRIYVYERDAPGSFNVPALYGRGFWTSLYASCRFARWGRLYLSGIYKKPGNAELKLQCVLHF